jgi:hypothetical protein
MRRIYEQSIRESGRLGLRGSGSDLAEVAEDHHANDEAPEDHCRDEEGCGAQTGRSPAWKIVLFKARNRLRREHEGDRS